MEQPPNHLEDYLESDNWHQVIDSMRQATLEVLLADDSRYQQLVTLDYNDFWSIHVEILRQMDAEDPGVAEAIMARSQAINQERVDQRAKDARGMGMIRAVGRGARRGFMKSIGS